MSEEKMGLHFFLAHPPRKLNGPGSSILLTPWSNAMNAFSSNTGNISLRRSIGSVCCARGDIDLGQSVQQFGGTTLGNSGTTMDHEIIIQPIRFSTCLH